MKLDAQIPGGPLEAKWDRYRGQMKLVSPANKRKHTILVVGTGLARVLSATLIGRAGAQRGSVAVYFVPLVAVVLGVLVRDESISAIQFVGLAVVLLSALLVSRPAVSSQS